MKPLKLALLLLVLVTNFSFGQSYSGTILRVIDGDTYVFQTSEGAFKVRMLHIDAPESKQAFGKESTAFLNKYANKPAKTVVSATDPYGRMLGVLFVDSVNINLLSVKNGFSWHFKRYSKDIAYADAEKAARGKKIGLWASSGAVAPWEWRKMNK